MLEKMSQNLVTGLISLCGQSVYDNWFFRLSICYLSALNSSFIACYAKMDMGPFNMFPLPTGILLSFVNRGHWRDIAGGRVLLSCSQVLSGSQQAPEEGHMASLVTSNCSKTLATNYVMSFFILVSFSSPDTSACTTSPVCDSEKDPLASSFPLYPSQAVAGEICSHVYLSWAL